MLIRKLEIVRGAWGLALLVAPRTVLTRVHHVTPDRPAVVVARVLGIRHLTQALVCGIDPTPAMLAVGAWVDLAHAGTAVPLTGVGADYHRAGWIETVIAGSWAVLGIRDLSRPEQTAPATGWRDALARIVLRRLPATGALRRRV